MNHIRQYVAVAVTSGVAVASLGLSSAAAANSAASAKIKAPTTTSPAAAAAGYLARNLAGKHHDHYTSSYQSGKKTITYINYGETADAVLSMDAAGVAQTAAARATAYLEKHVKAYAGTAASNYAPGAIGKLMVVAEAQHVGVRSFGGLDLVAAIKTTEGARGAASGEYQQNPKGTPNKYDYFATVSQALAVLALANRPHASVKPGNAAVRFLADQQCPDGGYPTQIMTSATAACAGGDDIDSTGYAVQALVAAGAHADAAKSLTFLKNAERANGGFGAKGSPPNANSTALAIQALLVGHDSVKKPQRWLARRQVRCGGKASRRGAVKLQSSFDSSALLATSQAGAALAGKPLASIDRHGAKAASPVLSCPKKKT